MRVYGCLLVVLALSMPEHLAAQETSPATEAAKPADESAEAEHEQLRELREVLTEAVLKGDVDTQIQFVDSDVVTTWQNNQVARGHDGLRKFMVEMNSGGEKVFQGYTVRPTSDEIAILHGGDTAIAVGKSIPHYKLLGMEFDLENRWTAALVKKDGEWKVAAYHVSGNILDNPVLTAAKKSVYLAAGVSLAIGLLLGAVGMKLISRKQTSVAGQPVEKGV